MGVLGVVPSVLTVYWKKRNAPQPSSNCRPHCILPSFVSPLLDRRTHLGMSIFPSCIEKENIWIHVCLDAWANFKERGWHDLHSANKMRSVVSCLLCYKIANNIRLFSCLSHCLLLWQGMQSRVDYFHAVISPLFMRKTKEERREREYWKLIYGIICDA